MSLLVPLTVVAFLVMGYHPGLEDDAFYLAAIKKNLNPALFPHDADFFRVQFQATIFDKAIALSVRLTHLPLAWAELLWQIAAIFLLHHGCWRISRRCFSDTTAQWASVAMIAALLTLPVTGTGINLADQYLHPRTLATAAILAAIVNVIDRRLWRAGLLLTVAFAIHALMAGFGISLCAFLWWRQNAPQRRCAHLGTGQNNPDSYQGMPSGMPIGPSNRLAFRRWGSAINSHQGLIVAAAIVVPFGWLFEPASDPWRQAAATRSFYFVTHWQWYEWLGIFAPLVLLWAFERLAPRVVQAGHHSSLPALISALVAYGTFQMIVGLVIMLVPGLLRLRPFEPMRYLHLLYLFFFLIVGALLGRYVLHSRLYRWLLLFVPLSAGMFYAQRQMYPATAHLEIPGAATQNGWLQAFAWIRHNTPVDALFALDPHYITLPGEDYHGFRGLAERSVLADYEKDAGMVARVPSLAPRWLREVTAQIGWKDFRAADFQRLRAEFGVTWVIVERSHPQEDDGAMKCPYQNQQLRVCRLY